MQRNSISKDHQLTIRMIITGLMLCIAYVALFGLLLISGMNPIFVFVIGIGMVAFQYFMSDKLVLKATGAKSVTKEEEPKLHGMIERLSQVGGIPKPRTVAIMDIDAPNAFATGRSPKHATVAVTTGLLNRLNDDELEGVIGHELAHIKNRDVMVMTWASLIVVVAGFLMQMLFWMSLFGGFGGHRREGNGGQAMAMMMAVYVGVIVIYFISQLLISTLSRYRELAADREGAIMTGSPSNLASALKKISGQIARIPEKDLRKVEHANAFFIIPALQGNAIASLMSSHPPTEVRVERLMEMQRQNWHLLR
ncbi:MAG TPA: zinc metalloprotease HtpX [Dehalococcoidia bacterium]|nr:zinc metalloprotease HtpX [Chloroflexota bacterium]HCE75948.1 zinc metalloprotease HtpX [Dehalococcoidia bacterium]